MALHSTAWLSRGEVQGLRTQTNGGASLHTLVTAASGNPAVKSGSAAVAFEKEPARLRRSPSAEFLPVRDWRVLSYRCSLIAIRRFVYSLDEQ